MSTPITKEGRARLQDELQRLRTTERPAIVAAIAAARAHGDLSENAEYHSAKEKQGMIEARAKELNAILSTAQVINPAALNADGRCIFGAYVTLREDNGNTAHYRIVGEYEADIGQGLLSSTSPLGRALLGKYRDESVAVETPGGLRNYLVVDIAYQK